jgi:hypothetical protein
VTEFERQQHALGDPQQPDHHDRRQREPQQDVDPERRLDRQLEPDGKAGDDGADDEDQERRRPVADVEAGEVEPAGAARRSEGGEAGEQRLVAAARA